MKKLLAMALAAAMVLSLAACGSGDGSASSDSTEKDSYTVGICQLVQHEALDAATEGFKDALTEELGDKVTFEEEVAQGDPNYCATIVNDFTAKPVDLILANATPALQAAAAGTDTIPILGTSVTEYGVALGIDGFDGLVGGNISGTSDLAPLDEQAAMLHDFFPDAKKVGLIYCTAEANSLYQVENVAKCLEEEYGYDTEMYSFTEANDLATIVTSAVETCDVLYAPTDNTVAANTEIIKNIIVPAKVPLIAGEEGICKGCGIATLSISYYDLGYATGQMAAKILKGEAKIEEMPIEYAPQFTKKANAELCAEYGIEIPEGYETVE